MKRIRIWLSNFTLLQQFLSIGFITVAILTFFIISFLSKNIDNFVNSQMYSYIHRAQTSYIQSSESNHLYEDTNILHFVYSVKSNRYLTKISPEQSDIVKQINPIIDNTIYDGSFEYNNSNIVYSVTKFTDEYNLVSIIRNDYRNEFRNALISGVISVTIYVVIGIIALIMLWVVSLISPLNSIRNYIIKIKNGEPAKLNIERHDEIGEVAESLVSMNEELSKQQHIRDEMIQNISHDLKTPIATIKSYSESINDGIYPYGTLEKSVDVIIEHANRLEKKVYSLITYNKLGYLNDNAQEGLNLEMAPIIQKVILSAQLLRSDVSIETNINDKVCFHGEEESWRVVVENLLDNALRYAKTKVTINLNDNLLEVINDGEQMSQDRIEKLFKPYEKGTKGNFGLGLSIVKKVCETYGYTVLGENLDNGVVFRIYTTKKMKKPSKKKKGIIEE